MPVVARILDANANRAREGLRVVEDGLRFVLQLPDLTDEAKHLRHRLAEVLAEHFPGITLASWRDSRGDIGRFRDIACRPEFTAILRNNLGRTAEALRSLEEYAKCLDLRASREFHRLRFRVYALEERLACALARGRFPIPCVYVIVDMGSGGNPVDLVRRIAPARPDVVQLRAKQVDARHLLAAARRIRAMVTGNTLFIVNDRPDIAVLCGADGVHLGQSDLPPGEVRKIFPHGIIGRSCTRLSEVLRAQREPVDYIGFGPVFPSPTEPERKPAGLAALTEAVKHSRIPVVGIGGITLENVRSVVISGAAGAVLLSAIQTAARPERVIHSLRRTMRAESSRKVTPSPER